MRIGRFSIGIGILFSFVGCNSFDITELAEGPGVHNSTGANFHLGKVRVSLSSETQLDSNLIEAEILITEVQIRSAEGGYLVFPQTDHMISLSDLGQGIENIIGQARAPNGSYDQIRLITAEYGTATLADSSQVPLRVPSGSQSGIKIFFDSIDLSFENIAEVDVISDLSKSFVFPGHGNEVLFKPVVRGELSFIENPDAEDDNGDGSSNDEDEGEGSESGDEDEDGSGNEDDDFPVIGV